MTTTRLGQVVILTVVLCAVALSASALSAGVARRDITPPPGGGMYGYAARGSDVSTGVHDPLLARALVLRGETDHVVIIALDLGNTPRDVMRDVRETVYAETGLENLLFAASHSHSSAAFQRDFPSEDAPWQRDVATKISEAVCEAAENLAPARVGMGRGEVAEGHNRRVIGEDGKAEMLWANPDRIPTSPVDHSVGVLRVELLDGTVLATVVNFTCHPVVLGPDNLLLSADYPGALTARVEAAIGGQCLFVQGACGDINPFGDKTPVDEGGFEEMQRMGHAVADEVLRVSEDIAMIASDVDITFYSETLSLAPRRVRDRERTVEAELNTVTIGDMMALATFPGEYFVDLGLSLKARSKFPHTWFVGYCNGSLGYVPTINAYVEGGYGADFGVRVAPGAGEYNINRALINLYQQMGWLR